DVLELEKAVEERFREMESFLARVSFSLEHAKSALNMVNLELPPNSLKNQQFKDSAIWQSLLELSRAFDVFFVTGDKGFFAGRDPKNGLADNLQSDCQRVGGRIVAFHELSQ